MAAASAAARVSLQRPSLSYAPFQMRSAAGWEAERAEAVAVALVARIESDSALVGTAPGAGAHRVEGRERQRRLEATATQADEQPPHRLALPLVLVVGEREGER